MTDHDINQSIARLKEEIAAAERRIAEAEKNIRQLTVLQKDCGDYQTEVGYTKSKRKTKRESFMEILNQDYLVDAYGYVLEDILNGLLYGGAYQNMEEIKTEVGREIERQQSIISSCRSEIARLNSSIDSLRQSSDDAG